MHLFNQNLTIPTFCLYVGNLNSITNHVNSKNEKMIKDIYFLFYTTKKNKSNHQPILTVSKLPLNMAENLGARIEIQSLRRKAYFSVEISQ